MGVSKRRVGFAGLAVVGLALTACGTTPGTQTTSAPTAAGPAAITVRGCTPQNALIGANTTEVCGGNILDAVNAKLVHYNSDTAAPELDVAQSIETEDNQTFTVKLNQGYKFHDGTEVKAKNFVDAWNFAAYGPNGMSSGYFMEPIEGYGDLQCSGDDVDETTGACKEGAKPAAETMTGLKVVDDYTFTIKTALPVSNLPVRLGYSAFSPMPDAFFTDPASDEFGKMPIGAGPFKIVSNSATEIKLEKFADYSGKYAPKVDQVTFRIYNDAAPAYADTVANNLDITDLIPSDQLANDQWKSDLPDRNGIRESGIVQTMTPAFKDTQLDNVDLLKAFSMAIDRETITKEIFQGTREPLAGLVSPVVDGYKADQCGEACVYDAAKAKDMYDKAGGYDGTLTITVNQDGGHKPWADAVCNGWKKDLGVDCQVVLTPDFATLRKQVKAGELMGFHRSGWQMDYPHIENFLTPLYATGASSNDGKYANPDFDAKIKAADAATDPAEANKLYQEAEKMVLDDMAVIPKWSATTPFGWSENVTNVKLTPFGTIDLSSVTKK